MLDLRKKGAGSLKSFVRQNSEIGRFEPFSSIGNIAKSGDALMLSFSTSKVKDRFRTALEFQKVSSISADLIFLEAALQSISQRLRNEKSSRNNELIKFSSTQISDVSEKITWFQQLRK